MKALLGQISAVLLAGTVLADASAWSPEVDGLSARVISETDYGVGQAVSLRLELRNRSERTRWYYGRFDAGSRHFKVSATNPAGKAMWENDGDETPPRLRMWVSIAAGKTRAVELSDLSPYFIHDTVTHWQGAFHAPGEYTLNLRYRPPKLRALMHEKDGATPEAMLANAWLGTLVIPEVKLRIVPVRDLTVHEWGVFTVYNDLRFANIDRKAEWSSLPEEFYRQFPRQRLHWVPSAWDKPIVYFHTARPNLRFRAKVKFTRGAPVVWWPAVARPLDTTPGRRPELSSVPRFNELEWRGWLGAELPGDAFARHGEGWQRPQLFNLPAKAWLLEARKVPEAVPLTVWGSTTGKGPPWNTARMEHEKFLYYDGLVPAPDYLRCTASDAGFLALAASAPFPLGPVYLVDRRGAKPRGAIVSGMGKARTVKPALPVSRVKEAFSAALLEAGLLTSERAGLLEIWEDGLFQRPGVTAFYLLPRAEYDRMLPLQVSPEPVSTVRVGIARHPNLEGEPALVAKARAFITELEHEDPKRREAATRGLIELGPTAIREIKSALRRNPGPETRFRGRLVLEQVDASDYLAK